MFFFSLNKNIIILFNYSLFVNDLQNIDFYLLFRYSHLIYIENFLIRFRMYFGKKGRLHLLFSIDSR